MKNVRKASIYCRVPVIYRPSSTTIYLYHACSTTPSRVIAKLTRFGPPIVAKHPVQARCGSLDFAICRDTLGAARETVATMECSVRRTGRRSARQDQVSQHQHYSHCDVSHSYLETTAAAAKQRPFTTVAHARLARRPQTPRNAQSRPDGGRPET